MKKEITKKDLQKVITDLHRNLENLFATEFYSPDEYKLNLDELENFELYLTFNKYKVTELIY
jgi:hypothetical protein